MSIQFIPSTYIPGDVKPAIVHLGLGAFMRAHLAVYNEKLLNQSALRDWGICAVNIRSNADIVETLQQQNLRYHIAEFKNSEELILRQVSSIREVLFAGDENARRALLRRLQDQAIKIVSLTVTEKGYYLNPANRELLRDAPDIQHDLENPDTPKTALGILTAALKHRFQNHLVPFTLLSCDNMPSNGKSLKSALIQFASIQNPELSRWIEQFVCCPSTMVDRIVPAATPQSLQLVNALLNKANPANEADRAAVTCEQFSQWVIEDRFSLGRPDWDSVGAQFVVDVEPFETMKLRMLNGSHSLLAYLGCLGGFEFVADCMSDAEYTALIHRYMIDEAAPTLDMPDGVDLETYAESLLQRFRNDSLQHRCAQIAIDGSNKIPQRWLAGTMQLLNDGTQPKIAALGIAAWMRYSASVDEQGNVYKVDDPLAATFQSIHTQNQLPCDIVNAMLNTRVFSGSDIKRHPKFINTIVDFYQRLLEHGARNTVQQLLSKI